MNPPLKTKVDQTPSIELFAAFTIGIKLCDAMFVAR
jgi:hypothetical protein